MEKTLTLDDDNQFITTSPPQSQPFYANNALFRYVADVYTSFADRRAALGLSNPGNIEGISREVHRDVLLSTSAFTGLRADISYTHSANPLFQTSHSLASGMQELPPYNYATMYGTASTFLNANIDNSGQFMGRANWRLTPSWVTKMMVQMAPNSPQSMFQIENDLSGKDFSLSLKALNPSMLDGGTTGIFITHYLQSLTPRLSLGVEMLWQRQSMAVGPDSMVSYSGRYRGSDWIATAQLQGQGAVTTSYWRRLTDKVDVGADLNLQFAGISGAGGESLLSRVQKDGQATLGAKYSFAQSIFRAQVDSGGALAVLLEKQVLPPVKVTFSGELDHVKNTTKVGLAISLDLAPEEVMENQDQAPTPPF